MAGTRILKPSISIGGVEFKCKSRSVSFTPGDWLNFCEREWTLEVELDLSYGADGSWNLLEAMFDTTQEIIISPSDGVVSVDNPSATFDAIVNPIAFMDGATRGERQSTTIELVAETDPVFDYGGS